MTDLTRERDEDITLEDLKVKKGAHNDVNAYGRGWYEIKMTGKLPERRSYQISEVFEGSLYIFGGQDLKEGTYNNLWRLPLNHIMEGGATSWEKVTNMTGKAPPPISHHSGFLYKDTLYVFGGLVEGDSNKDMYALNLKSFHWSIVEKPENGF